MAEPAAAEQTDAATRKARILVVDDEEDILTTTAALLRRRLENVEVDTVGSGAEALRALAERPADLLITDFRMPHMNGLELLDKATEVAPQARRILMTAYPDMYLAIEALNDHRISYFLVKPLDPREFPRQVADCLLENRRDEARDALARSALDMVHRWREGGGAVPG